MKKRKFGNLIVTGAMVVMGGLALTGGMALTGATGVPTAWAEENAATSTMTLSPMNQQIILTPGEVYQGSIRVSNPSGATQNLKYSVSVGSFSQEQDENGKDGAVNTEDRTAYNQIMDWITLERTSGEVEPNGTQDIPFTINVPADAPAGGQYATILVQNDTEEEKGTGNIAIQSQLQMAHIIYAEVAGETHKSAQILDNSIPRFILSSPLRATSMVQNDGNVHTDATYTLQVWPIFSDEEVCTNEEEPSESLVMPGAKRYHVESCDVGLVGLYRAKQVVTIFGETSVLEVPLVIVCPIWLILIVVAVIIGVIIWLVQRARRRRRMKRQV